MCPLVCGIQDSYYVNEWLASFRKRLPIKGINMSNKESNANIRFNRSEIQWLILALQFAEKCSELCSQTDMSNAFQKLRVDLVKIKDALIEKENTVVS
tara:strand:+ start:369 stop:662 length:294 start_codon:yes stop_codon:yes gene_type:complete